MTEPTKSTLSGSVAAEQPTNASEEIENIARITSAGNPLLDAYAKMREAMQEVQHSQAEFSSVAMSAEAFGPGVDLRATSPVRGVAIALGSETTGGLPGEPSLRLYMAEQMSQADAINHAAGVFDVQALVDGSVAVDVTYTGEIDVYSHRARWRPTIPCGVSIGHVNITAGTLGCYARARSSDRKERQLILSNNHVLADVNAGSIGDDILQPGKHDGGQTGSDVVALLEHYVVIDFNGTNYVDAATGWIDDAYTDRRFLYMTSSGPNFFNVSPTTRTASSGQQVGKSGRTTGLTSGYVAAVGAAINVNMGSAGIAHFADQIEIRGTRGNFSAGGDSGSLIWTWDAQRNPIGLLFAGGGRSTFANPIDTVLNALDIELDSG